MLVEWCLPEFLTGYKLFGKYSTLGVVFGCLLVTPTRAFSSHRAFSCSYVLAFSNFLHCSPAGSTPLIGRRFLPIPPPFGPCSFFSCASCRKLLPPPLPPHGAMAIRFGARPRSRAPSVAAWAQTR